MEFKSAKQKAWFKYNRPDIYKSIIKGMNKKKRGK